MAGAKQHIPENLAYFVTLPDEKLLLVERKHWFVLLRDIGIILLLTIPFCGTAYLVFKYLLHYPQGFISAVLVIVYVLLTLVVKVSIEWYLHLFIVTNRKILEVWYSPLFFYKINGVLLDQVRCTEIDEQKSGILHELIDMGNIIITFDRPTHQAEFVLQNVKNPREIASKLSDIFAALDKDTTQPIWYKPNKTVFENYSQHKFSWKGGEHYV